MRRLQPFIFLTAYSFLMKKCGASETSARMVGLSCCGTAGFYIYAVSMNLLKVIEVLASVKKNEFFCVYVIFR